MTAERTPPSEQLARAIDRAEYASLRPVLASLSLVFFFFAFAHPLVLEPGPGVQMSLLAGATAFLFLGMYGALQTGRLYSRRPLVYTVTIAGVVLANALIHMHLVGKHSDTTNLLLCMVGAGFLLLSTRWLLIFILATFTGFYLVALEHPPFGPWAGYIFALGSASVLALLVHVIRLKTVVGFEELRMELEDKVEERTRSLASERNLLRTLVDSLPDGVFVKDTAGRYRIANAAHRRQLGVATSEELAHRTVGELVPGPWADGETAEDRRVVVSGTPVLDREQEVRTNGTPLWLLTSKVPVTDPAGQVTGLVGVTRDMTATREAEQARRLLDQQFQETQKLESLGVLAGGIAHDFNNLLTGVLGNISLARVSLDDVAETRVYLDSIETAAVRAGDLCQQMLAYAGKGRFHEQRLDLGVLVADMMPLLRLSVAKGVTLRLDVGPKLPAIWADPAQMRQVVLNLVVNGSDAITDAGSVDVRVRAMAAGDPLLDEMMPAIQVPEAGCLVLDVIDTGCGMPPDMQARVFEPFFTTKFTGRGLGLAVVQGIVRGHKGGLRVESAPRRGSRFTVALPATTEAAEPLERLALTTGAWRGSGLALVADDEDIVRDVAQTMLEELGFQVVSTANGQEAIDAFAKQPSRFSVVLLDLTMPVLNGADALRGIRAIAPGARVLMMSGYNEQETAERFLGAAPNAFIHKPFSLAALRERLQHVLG